MWMTKKICLAHTLNGQSADKQHRQQQGSRQQWETQIQQQRQQQRSGLMRKHMLRAGVTNARHPQVVVPRPQRLMSMSRRQGQGRLLRKGRVMGMCYGLWPLLTTWQGGEGRLPRPSWVGMWVLQALLGRPPRELHRYRLIVIIMGGLR